MENLPRRERERLRREREFLEAAEAVFFRKGFHNATIQEISEESEFAVGSIYHMFRNKDEIYLALLKMRLEEYLARLEEEIQGVQDPIEKIDILIETKLRHFFENKPFLRLFLETTIGPGWGLPMDGAQELRDRYEEHLRFMAGLFEAGIKKKRIAGNDPIGMALAVDGMVRAFVTYWIRHDGQDVAWPQSSTIREILFQGILRKNTNRKKKCT